MNQQEQEDLNLINKNMYHNKLSRDPAKKKFLMGAGLTVMGLAMGYYFVYLKVLDILNHAEQVNYSYKAMLISPLCIVFGLYYMLCRPSGANAWKEMESKDKPFFVITMILAFGSFGGLWYWFELLLKQNGYS
ncbi:MAG: hypothetical protein WBP13_06380 [Methylophilaceae bacterium]